jgi:hypothetical protein
MLVYQRVTTKNGDVSTAIEEEIWRMKMRIRDLTEDFGTKH